MSEYLKLLFHVLRTGAVISFLLLSTRTILAQTAPVSSDHPWYGHGEQTIEVDARALVAARFRVDPDKTYSLAELIDLAESHNPQTRVAWERARAQPAALGIARSELYPALSAVALSSLDRE